MDEHNRLEVAFKSIVQKREDLIVKKLNMSVSSLMRIYEIMDFKKQLEATTDKKQNKFALAEYYKQVKLAETSEDVSVAFIEVASMLFTSLLSSNRIQAILFQLDQMAVNPLDSVYKLREVAVQCEKKENLMHWVLSLLADWWFLTDNKDAIPIRSLKESAGGNVSLIKLMLFKKQLRDKLLRMMESEFPAWESSIKGEIRGLVESVEACRAKLGYFDSDDVKKTYEPRGSWPESADLWLLAFETLVYGYEHDEMIRTQLKNRRGVEDILDHGDIKHYIEKAKGAYQKETCPPSEVDEEAKNNMECEAAAVAEEMSVLQNLSQAENLLRSFKPSNDEEAEKMHKIRAAVRVAERRAAGQVTLCVDSPDCDDLESQLKSLMATKVRGDVDSKSYAIIVFDAKTLCESGSQGKYRLPPTRPAQVQRLLNSVLSTREDGDLADGDVLMALDGGKDNDWCSKNIIKHLPGKKYEIMKHVVTYTYDSVEKKMERASKSPLQLCETVSFVTTEPLEFKVQARLVSSGNTRGNVIGPLTQPSWVDGSETWLLPLHVKRSVFGKDNMPLPGGACPVPRDKADALKHDELVPAFYHESPQVLAAELHHFVQGRMVFDLTPGSSHWGLQCIRLRIPYIGICMTETHRDLLMKKLVSRTLSGMADSSDEHLYDASFAQELKALSNSTDADEGGTTEPKSRKRGSGKDPAGPKTIPKKLKKGEPPSSGAGPAADSRDELLKKIAAAAAESGGTEGEGDAAAKE
ncbi:unnamed protein product [Durusdinium trenchii]